MPEEPIAPAASQPPQRPRRRVPSARRFAAGALASFVAIFGVLALRVHDGEDPALANVATKTTSTDTTQSTSTDPSDSSSSSEDGSPSDGWSSGDDGDGSSSSSSSSGSSDSSGAVSSTPDASTSAS